ncbi:peptidase A4 family-domain-containing protein [Phanerochaete sordida]|uniref:Peptidase A4 family-domain-containing protein n=1 Tax=Phanerochaete sordida TaxID=48140 RepID=A0A9P3GQ50_9APHY|nr:peptidase A4 family-domain-containing protein [Phanerochaete sordida]
MLLLAFVAPLVIITALALPSSKERLDARVARRLGGAHVSRPRASAVSNGADASYSTNWAGAVLNSPADTYKSVTATFKLPTPKEPHDAYGPHSASAWVGLDGDSCVNAILQTGVDFHVDDGSIAYDAWYEWYPAASDDFSGIDLAAGDDVSVTVIAFSPTSGSATITNERTRQTVSMNIMSDAALCGQDAEWIVEDYEVEYGLAPFADFGQVVFTGATAQTNNGIVGPENANILILVQDDGQVLTEVETSDDSVTVTYVGH